MSVQVVFNIAVIVFFFTVANLAAVGLEINLREALRALQNAHANALITTG